MFVHASIAALVHGKKAAAEGFGENPKILTDARWAQLPQAVSNPQVGCEARENYDRCPPNIQRRSASRVSNFLTT